MGFAYGAGTTDEPSAFDFKLVACPFSWVCTLKYFSWCMLIVSSDCMPGQSLLEAGL